MSRPVCQPVRVALPRDQGAGRAIGARVQRDDLATVALRPHLIWGPGDNHLIPRLVARSRAGRLRKVGRRDHLVDSIYIDNAAEAHVQAADRLEPGAAVAGKVYFLSQGEPWPLWDLINRILAAAGAPPVTRSISAPAAVVAGSVLETVYRTFRLAGEPPMTRFLATSSRPPLVRHPRREARPGLPPARLDRRRPPPARTVVPLKGQTRHPRRIEISAEDRGNWRRVRS